MERADDKFRGSRKERLFILPLGILEGEILENILPVILAKDIE